MKVAIPAIGTLEMQIRIRPCVIGGIPRPAARGTERPEADREVFGETIARSKRQPDQPNDLFATIYNGRHLIFRKDDLTIISFPNYRSDQSNQMPRRYYVEPQIAGSASFSDKKKFFEHLLKHARVQVKVNISQALRRAALQMQTIKIS